MTGQPTLPARAWIDIDLGALVQNGRSIAAHAGRPILPMVKADAYGLGAVQAARALESLDPWGFGVATLEEGLELRRAGIVRPVLVCTPLLPQELRQAADAQLTPSLHDAARIADWAPTGRPWHLAVDTGMNRAGVPWYRIGDLHDLLRANPPQGVFTHFHSAELPDGSAERQLRRFTEVVDSLPDRPGLVHAENSAAIQRFGRSRFSLVRPGIFLYGVSMPELGGPSAVPVVAMRARVVDVRDVPDSETVSYLQTYRAVGERRIATIALGYADGYPRAASNRGWAMLNGNRVPVAGLVTMDMTMLDVTGVECREGDVATLLGDPDDGLPDVATLAFHSDSSPYEILTRLRSRIERRYAGMPTGASRERAGGSTPAESRSGAGGESGTTSGGTDTAAEGAR